MKKILIIEDELMLQQAYVRILESSDFKVFVAGDGQEGLEVLKKAKPDLILLDILMPRMDGLEFLQAANITQDYPRTKVLAFSNLSNTAKIQEMIGLGATKHILKSSVSPSELVKLVRDMLK